MLSMEPLKSSEQAAHYFAQENYYSKDTGLQVNYWWGDGARRLGLAGYVDLKQFEKALEGYLPNGETIERATVKEEDKDKKKERLPGTDATFSAPKSVSIAALVQGDTKIIEAHNRAVSRALEYAQDNCVFSVKKTNGKSDFNWADNLLVACFTHDTARQVKDKAIDPQLHTHAVIVNATQRDDGKWVAAPNTILMRDKMLLGAIYRAELVRELQTLGYQIRITSEDGQFEITGYLDEQIRAFSQRRVQIEKHIIENGLTYNAENAALAAKTSRSKKTEIDRVALKQEWKERAEELGLETPQLVQTPFLSGGESVYKTLLSAAEHLLERKSFVQKREILQLAMQRLVGVANIDHLEKAFAKAVYSRELMENKSNYFTSLKTIDLELQNKAAIKRGLQGFAPIFKEGEARELASLKSLSAGQVDAVALLEKSARYVAVQGYAGTGKTTMLKLVKELAESKGFEVRGFAPSAAAADVLKRGAGIESQTLASHLIELERSFKTEPKNLKSIWVVDESSMIGTKAMNQLLQAAERQQARVWFVGDKQQLSSIEAGNSFSNLLKEGVPVAEMREIHRQKNENLKSAVVDVIEGRTKESLNKLLSDIREVKNRDKRLLAVVEEYFKPGSNRKESLVITSTNEDKQQINQEIRRVLKEKNELQGPTLKTETLSSRNLTESDKKRLPSYSEGQIVRFGRDYKSIGVESGSYYRVSAVDYQQGAVILATLSGSESVQWKPARMAKVEVYHSEQTKELQAGDSIRWTRNDKETGHKNGEIAQIVSVNTETHKAVIENQDGKQTQHDFSHSRHWDYSYCSTVHAAQGQTCDRVIAHFDTAHVKLLSQESLYVAMSRARHEAKIFTDDFEKLPQRIKVSRAQENVLDAVFNRELRSEIERGFER